MIENNIQNGIFVHNCEFLNCEHTVVYDDEPYCYKHSPDSGSSIRGYSAYQRQLERAHTL